MKPRVFPAAPAARLAAVRIAVGLFGLIYLFVLVPGMLRLSQLPPERFAPVGPLHLFSVPPSALAVGSTWVLAVVSAVGFIRGHRVLGLVHAATLLLLTSHRSSFGMIFHTDNLLVVHTGVLALAPSTARAKLDDLEPSPRAGWPLLLMSWLTALTYFLAGWAKVQKLGLSWTEGEVLMGHIAYDALRKEAVGSLYSPLGVFLLGFPWLFAPLSTLSLVLELGAPLAPWNRRIGQLWAIGMWSFHLGVAAMMLIGFIYPLSGVAYLSFFPVERLAARISVSLRRLRALRPDHAPR